MPRILLATRQGFVRLFVRVWQIHPYEIWIGDGFDPRHAHQPSLRGAARQAGFNFPIPFLV